MQGAATITKADVCPTPLAHQAIHDSVMGILANQPRGVLLDVPAGEGALAARLIDAGFEVRCCDLYPEIFRLHNVDIHRGNLDAELPFSDRSFDYVTCLEGLEHIENPQQAMREFARVLKPSGHLNRERAEHPQHRRAFEVAHLWLHFTLQADHPRGGRALTSRL